MWTVAIRCDALPYFVGEYQNENYRCIIRTDGSLALIDFGISRVYKKESASDTVISGTEGFAPPEQYGFMQTDIRSDIYSFGVVLSWLLTGKEQPMKLPMPNLATVEMSAGEQYRMEELIAEYGEPAFQINYI